VQEHDRRAGDAEKLPPRRPASVPSGRGALRAHFSSRNRADMMAAMLRGLSDDLWPEAERALGAGKGSLTILGYVARFPPDEQRRMYELFQELGARGAKRYVECLANPPSPAAMAQRVKRWIAREFPTSEGSELAAALRIAAASLDQPGGDELSDSDAGDG
jgi:hypothetical protein